MVASEAAPVASRRPGTAKRQARKRETWRDWLPPSAPLPEVLYTRDELVRELERLDRGPRVTGRDLAYWESEGVIPAAVRQWHNGAVRALYPDWMVWLIVELRTLQAEGYNLTQIATKLRSPWRVYLAERLPHDDAIRADIQRSISRMQEAPKESPATTELREALRKFALFYAGLSGKMPAHVEIRIRDTLGNLIFDDDISIKSGERPTGTN